jgi:hypothetical protein
MFGVPKYTVNSVALVCALVRRPYCDVTPRSGNFQFQVRIIRHGHKFRVCRPPEDRMVCPREPHHFEDEGFCAEVPHVPKHDAQIDLPEGKHLDSRYDPMEWRCRRPQRGPLDAHVIKCRHIEHVDPAPPIHQDLVDPSSFEQGATTSG